MCGRGREGVRRRKTSVSESGGSGYAGVEEGEPGTLASWDSCACGEGWREASQRGQTLRKNQLLHLRYSRRLISE